MRKFVKLMVFCWFISTSLFAADATIDIVKYVNSAPKVMLQDGTKSGYDNTFKNRFFKMLVGDLKVTTHFKVMNQYVIADYEKDPKIVGKDKPSLIIQYKLSPGNAGKITAQVKLVNAVNGQVRTEKTYNISNRKSYPFLSHQIISDINDNVGAPSVAWMKRYVLMSKTVRAKESEIVLADYTLTYQKPIVRGGLSIFPKWANEKQDAFYYSSFTDKKPTLYKVDVRTGKRTKIISSQGMLVCSDVSKDGTKLVLTMAPKGMADIYVYNLVTKNLQQVTFYKGIDVNGGFVNNDKKVVFVSDRLGYPNIFAKNINGKGVEQMVYHGKNNNASTSYGNYIAYSSRDKDSEFGPSTFNLYLISTKTEYIRQLTASGKNLFPRFSNDGKSLMFIKEYGNQSALGIIRLSENKTFHFPLQVGKIQSLDW